MSYEQQRQDISKPIIIIQPGPPHLFYTTGVFYAWELSKKYDIVLLATDSYKEASWFDTILKTRLFKHVEYFPVRNSIAAHFYYRNNIPKILKEFNPKAVLMHSEFFIDNLYLIYFLKIYAPNTTRFYFQPGRMGVNIRANTIERHNAQVDGIRQKLQLPAVLYQFISILVHVKSYLSFVVNTKIFPLVAIKTKFHPPVNYITGDILFTTVTEKHKRADQQGIHLNYLPIEAEANLEHGAAKVLLITHPMQSCFLEALQKIYGSLNEENAIFIAPSHGFSSGLIADGYGQRVVISKISEAWSSAIKSLKAQYPSYKVKIKLHPASATDAVWTEVLGLLCQLHPDLFVVNPSEPAELYVSTSKIVVGDVSTVLWWASLIGNKVVISLDIFGYAGGGEMQQYSDFIWCFNNIDKLGARLESKRPKYIAPHRINIFEVIETYCSA